MTTIRALFSTACTIAALSLPSMAQGQRPVHVETICNDGTVITSADRNACRSHAGVRSVTHINNGRAARIENGKTLPGGGNVILNGRGDVIQNRRGDVVQNRNGMTTAEMMQQLHIDHTRNNATARCQDGFYYHGYHDRSACSHDGGVSTWYK